LAATWIGRVAWLGVLQDASTWWPGRKGTGISVLVRIAERGID